MLRYICMLKRVILIMLLVSLIVPATATQAEPSDTEAPTGAYPTVEGEVPISPGYQLALTASDNVGVTNAVVYINDKAIDSGELGITYSLTEGSTSKQFIMKWDTTKVANGKYKAQIQLKDAAGNKGWVLTAPNKQNYLTYVVSNPEQTATTPPAATVQPKTEAKQSSRCKISQEKLNGLMAGIVKKTEKHQTRLDDTLESIASADTGTAAEDITNSDEMGTASDAQEAAGEKIKILKDLKVDCAKDPKSDVIAFKIAYTDAKQSLIEYREAIQELQEKSNAKD
jgi:hypothetical protein